MPTDTLLVREVAERLGLDRVAVYHPLATGVLHGGLRVVGGALVGRVGWTISGRKFLGVTGGLVVAAACGGTKGTTTAPKAAAGAPTTVFKQPATKLSGDLRILQWSHFVPKHDQWFDPFAKDWGRRVGVNVSVDHVDLADLPTRLSAEIAGG